MTWEIALGIIALAGFLITVGTLVFKLASALSRMEASVKGLRESFAAERKEKEKKHGEMSAEMKAQAETIRRLELRIHDLERDTSK